MFGGNIRNTVVGDEWIVGETPRATGQEEDTQFPIEIEQGSRVGWQGKPAQSLGMSGYPLQGKPAL